MERKDEELNFDWGSGSPHESIPSDEFSVRWSRQLPLEGGAYRFSLVVDDGVRFWIDGQLLVDEWHESGGATYTVEHGLQAGEHDLVVEYFEGTGEAQIRLLVELLSASPSESP
jgi:hypothetical protein